MNETPKKQKISRDDRELIATIESSTEQIVEHYGEEKMTLIVAVSGGSDSMALLFLLKDITFSHPIKIVAAHLNHMLRGKESDSDEELVRKICKKLNVPCEVEHVDIKSLAKKQHASLEEAGRNARKTFFFQLKERYGADMIATAHHRDDNVETILMHMIRGASLRGLSGMNILHKGTIRPLLDFSKEEIETYCKIKNIPFRRDKSNSDTRFTRNYIRHIVIPAIEKLNPRFREHLHEKSFAFAEMDELMAGFALDFMKQWCQFAPKEIICPIEAVKSIHPAIQRSVIQSAYEIFHGSTEGLESEHINDILELMQKGKTGTEKMFGQRLRVEISYGKIVFQKEKPNEARDSKDMNEDVIALPMPGEIDFSGRRIVTRIHKSLPKKMKKNAVYIGLTGKNERFFIRSVKAGDRFRPIGMEGSKKIQDFFVDKKIPRHIRKNIPIIVDREGNIMAVGLLRVDKRADPHQGPEGVAEIQFLD